ncbi:hypothetical protein Ancab_023387 [Ancistrocladus abbreviatus]
MALWAMPTFFPKQLPLLHPVIFTTQAAVCGSRTSHHEGYSLPRRIMSSMHETCIKATPYAFKSENTFLENHEGIWEDPDDGNGSEYDDDDEQVEEGDFDFESDWEEEKDGSMAIVGEEHPVLNYEDNLVREVEQLLEPEEMAILQQNEAANLDKMSTAKWSALHTLALSGQIPFLDKLLADGVDINFVDKDGHTALHVAVIGKKEAVISHLLRKGANPHVKDKDGATPLHYAVQVGAMQTVKLLIKYSVDVNISDDEGWTPLHVAMQSRNRDVAKVLLVHGADKTRKNKDGKTPLDLSLAYGKDFKSYDLSKLLKLVPANRYL